MYQSPQAKWASIRGLADFSLFVFWPGWLLGNHLFLVPAVMQSYHFLRKIHEVNDFCFLAALLPHTQEMVFYKSGLFGEIREIKVFISDLERIPFEVYKDPWVARPNMYETNMIFRDIKTQESFVFDRRGLWNKETLDHPLLN